MNKKYFNNIILLFSVLAIFILYNIIISSNEKSVNNIESNEINKNIVTSGNPSSLLSSGNIKKYLLKQNNEVDDLYKSVHSMAMKEHFDEITKIKLNSNLIVPNDNRYSKEEQSNYLKKLEQAKNLANKNDWEQFMNLNDELTSLDHKTLTQMLMLSILYNAPFDVIIDLLNAGAELTSHIFKALIYNNNLTLIKKLISYGLDIHMIDKQGKNAIYYSLYPIPNKVIFNYFITNGVSTKPSLLGKDPLDIAMQQCLNNQSSVYFIKMLLEYGSPIQDSHIELFRKMISKNSYCVNKIRDYFISS